MASRAEKDRQKQIQDKCQALLTQMLRDEDNKYCVDCDAKGPRWASWNLGIFLCIRCAGIHRNLGVHISKVKSVNLDTWTPEQVVSLQQMGNSRARAVYEANLPDNFRRPQTDSSLEAFVRAKYEQKKYIAREWVPPPIPKVNWDKELDEEAERQRRRKKEAKQQQTKKSNTALAEVPVPQLLPKPKSSSPKPGRSSIEANRKSATQDLLGLDTPVNNTATSTASGASSNGEDIFTNFLSAPPATTGASVSTVDNGPEVESIKSQGRSAEEESFFNQPAPSSHEKRQLTKDSILALYSTGRTSTPAVPASVFGMPGGVYSQPAPTFQQVPSALGFGIPASSAIPNGMMPAQTISTAAIMQQNGTYNAGALTQPAALASNPFFNMGTSMASSAPGFTSVAQEHVSCSGQDLLQDFGSTIPSSVCQLPQQMNRLNLGGPVMATQPQSIMGVAPQAMAMGMPVATMGIQSAVPANSAAMGMGAFPQQGSQGHTLATNLWQ